MMTDLKEKAVLNLKESAEYLGVSVPTMYKVFESNTLVYRRFGKRYLVAREELDKWLRNKAEGKGEN